MWIRALRIAFHSVMTITSNNNYNLVLIYIIVSRNNKELNIGTSIENTVRKCQLNNWTHSNMP